MGPGFSRGSGGGSRGCGFEERVGVHAHTWWIHFLWLVCLSVCLSDVAAKVAVGHSKKSVSFHRGESRNELRGLKVGG